MKEKRARQHPKPHGCRRILLLSGIALLIVCSTCSLYVFVPDIYYSFPVQKLLEDLHLVSNILIRAEKQSDMIAFSCRHRDGWRSSLYSIHPDGSNLRLLREHPSQAHVGLTWSPDGNWIAFHTRVSSYYWSFSRHWSYDSSTPEIYRIRFDGSISKRLTYNNDWEKIPKWSNDGNHLFYASRGLRQISILTGEIRVINDQLFWIYDLTSDGTTIALTRYSEPSASPSGADTRGNTNEVLIPYAIYRMNSDGSDLRLLKHLDDSVIGMQWSPDNSFLLFHRYNGRPIVLNVRTLEEVHAPAMRTLRAKWSPDSRWLAIIGEEGIYREGDEWHKTSDYERDFSSQIHNLYLLDFETDEVKDIVDDVNASGLAWSPDSEWIAFSRPSYLGQLFKVKRDGADLQQLTDLDCRIQEISWSPK